MARRLAAIGLALFTATASLVAAAPAHADETTGTISGHLTDGGVGLADIQVFVRDLSFVNVASTTTGPDGSYAIPDITPGSYNLFFTLVDGAVTQFWPQTFDYTAAGVIEVAAGSATVIDEAVLPHGTITARIVDLDGAPAFATITLLGNDPTTPIIFANNDEQGDVTFRYLPPGSYDMSVEVSGHPKQWVPGGKIQGEAQHLEVVGGGHLTFTETLLPAGVISGHFHECGCGCPGHGTGLRHGVRRAGRVRRDEHRKRGVLVERLRGRLSGLLHPSGQRHAVGARAGDEVNGERHHRGRRPGDCGRGGGSSTARLRHRHAHRDGHGRGHGGTDQRVLRPDRGHRGDPRLH